MNKKYIGNQLKKFREYAGYKIEELAYFFGNSLEMIEKWENGEKQPDLQQCMMLTKLYGTSFEEMFSGVNVEDLLEEEVKEEFNHQVWLNGLVRRSGTW